MNVRAYKNVEDVFAAARIIRDDLLAHGNKEAAAQLDETINCFWTTSSEALDETIETFLSVRPTVQSSLNPEMLQLLDDAVAGATELWNGN